MQKRAEQLEIFSINKNYANPGIREFKFSFLTRIRAYEKVILVFICLLIIGLVSFSFGVERGKKISLRKIASDNFDLAMRQSQVPKQNEPIALAPPPPIAVKQIVIAKFEKPKFEKPKAAGAPAKNIRAKKAKETEKKAKKVDISSSAYTVQVASFKVNKEALREAESLKKKGFASVVLNKGSYLIVCVGNYSSKEQAATSMKKLKKNYQDCLIRRL